MFAKNLMLPSTWSAHVLLHARTPSRIVLPRRHSSFPRGVWNFPVLSDPLPPSFIVGTSHRRPGIDPGAGHWEVEAATLSAGTATLSAGTRDSDGTGNLKTRIFDLCCSRSLGYPCSYSIVLFVSRRGHANATSRRASRSRVAGRPLLAFVYAVKWRWQQPWCVVYHGRFTRTAVAFVYAVEWRWQQSWCVVYHCRFTRTTAVQSAHTDGGISLRHSASLQVCISLRHSVVQSSCCRWVWCIKRHRKLHDAVERKTMFC